MPNYLLQWEAIKHSKNEGCTVYDLWGAPEVFDVSDDLWGVYRFKKGLGSMVVNRIGAFDFPTNRIAYKIFVKYLPNILSITRRIRKIQQTQEIE
jgi:lipid II:glycine glycyltransferase (peptidoglycan interpeptide bridge formation enzyme)